jgi:hypothetical protein
MYAITKTTIQIMAGFLIANIGKTDFVILYCIDRSHNVIHSGQKTSAPNDFIDRDIFLVLSL